MLEIIDRDSVLSCQSWSSKTSKISDTISHLKRFTRDVIAHLHALGMTEARIYALRCFIIKRHDRLRALHTNPEIIGAFSLIISDTDLACLRTFPPSAGATRVPGLSTVKRLGDYCWHQRHIIGVHEQATMPFTAEPSADSDIS